MFVCDKKYACCAYQYWDKLEDVDDEHAKSCQHLIEVAPVQYGEWVPIEENVVECSVCKEQFNLPINCNSINDCGMLYCCHCGARMSDSSSADINCADGTTTDKIDAKWIYETGIESPEILGSGSSFSSVATISNEDDAKEAYKKGGRNYLLRYKYDNARKIIQYWNGYSWESH